MKKLMVMAALVALSFGARADFHWDWWNDSSDDNRGFVLGLSSDRGTITGAQVDLCISRCKKLASGVLYAVGYSQAEEVHKGAQVAFFTNAKRAALQLGLICHNEESSFCPWFILFNFNGNLFRN